MYTFGFISPTTAVIVLVIALVIFGPGKLPDLGRSLGQGIKEFKSATDGEAKDSKTEKSNDSQSKNNQGSSK